MSGQHKNEAIVEGTDEEYRGEEIEVIISIEFR